MVIEICKLMPTESMLSPSPPVEQDDAQSVCKLTLGSLFDSEETPLLRYAFSLTGRRAVAEEIVQEVFLQLHARWDEVEAPRAWLFRSVRNRAYSHLRDTRRESPTIEDGKLSFCSADDEPADQEMIRMEATGVLRETLSGLADDDRQLIQMKYFEGMKYREIAERTGLSVGNVGYRLHHLLKELAAKLRPLGIDEQS